MMLIIKTKSFFVMAKFKHFMQNIIWMIVVLAGVLACQSARVPKSPRGFYNLMLKTNQDKVLVLKEFPEALKPMEHLYRGNILTMGKDTLQLVCSFPNLSDTLNRYPFYFMRDNHGNYWTMFHEDDDKYHIYRENSDIAKDYFKDIQNALDAKWFQSHRIGGAFLMKIVVSKFISWNYLNFY